LSNIGKAFYGFSDVPQKAPPVDSGPNIGNRLLPIW